MSKRKISYIWNFFEKDEFGQPFAVCSLCKKEYRTSGNTSNLRDHLQRFHKSALTEGEETDTTTSQDIQGAKSTECELPKKKQLKISTFYKKPSSVYTDTNPRKIMLDQLLAYMIAEDYQPFSIVTDTGFLKFVGALDASYRVPSKTTVREKLMPKIFKDMSEQLQTILNNIDYVALTTDLWTSCAGEGFITVTSQFIFEDEVRSAVLETVQVEGHHTAENIKNYLQNVIIKWKLQNKVECIVTDNAKNMINACTLLHITHLPCFAHTLNLTVSDGVSNSGDENLQQLLLKSKNIVRHFKKSTLAMDKLMEEQRKKNEVPLKPLQEVSTRWNSVLYMLERLLILNEDDCLTITLSKLPNSPDILLFDDIAAIKEVIKVLKPFEDATNQVSGENYITISLIIPIVVGIQTHLQEIASTLKTNIALNLNSKLLDSVVKRLFPYEQRTGPRAATLLDPRFKKHAFRSPENANQAEVFVQKSLQSLGDLLVNKGNPTTVYSDIHQPSTSSLSSVEPSKSTTSTSFESCAPLYKFLNERISLASTKATPTSVSIILVRQYLESMVIPMNENPLSYWQHQSPSQAEIYQLAKRYLLIPATSVSSERIFSKTGQIISARRANLKSKHVNMLVFINKNKWLSK